MCVISSEKCIIGLSLFVVGVHLLTAEIGMRWRARLYDTLYIAGSSSSQTSVEKTIRRRQSQRSDAGDGREIAAVTMSSVSTWQQFTTSVRSAAYFCLVTCPAGMFITISCCIVNRIYFCAEMLVECCFMYFICTWSFHMTIHRQWVYFAVLTMHKGAGKHLGFLWTGQLASLMLNLQSLNAVNRTFLHDNLSPTI